MFGSTSRLPLRAYKSLNSAKSSKQRAFRRAVSLAAGQCAAGLERLENRTLMSAVPSATIVGQSAAVNEGAPYTVNLASTLPAGVTVTQWNINWGDGGAIADIQTVPGNPTTATHTYADNQPTSFSVTGTALLSDGSTLTANVAQTGAVQDGLLDPSFNAAATPGKATSTAAVSDRGTVVLDNGQIVQVGMAGGATLAMTRFNADGSLDTTFGNNGVVTAGGVGNVVKLLVEKIPNPYGNHLGSVQRLVVVGMTNTHPFSAAVWRFNLDNGADGVADGTPDTLFNAADATPGKLVIPPALAGAFIAANDIPVDAAVDLHGNIIVVSQALRFQNDSFNQVAVARVSSAGVMDTSFHTTGETILPDNGGGFAQSIAVVVGPDDSIYTLTNDSGDHLIKLDPTGTSATVSSMGPADIFRTMTLDNSQNLLLAGTNGMAVTIGRFTLDGAPLAGFGNAGVSQVVLDAHTDGGSFIGASSVAATPDGKIVVGGQIDAFFVQLQPGDVSNGFVSRFNADGTLDTSFGGPSFIVKNGPSGTERINFAANDAVHQLVVLPNGQILVGGDASDGQSSYMTLARLGTVQNSTAQPVNVVVNNVAPSASITGASAASEGATILLGSVVTDPGTLDTAAGFNYAWQLSKNGAPIGGASGHNANTFSFTPDDNGSYAVTLTATDKDGGVSTVATQNITVANVAPVASAISASQPNAVRGQALTFSSSFTDPGVLDTHTVTWNFGDGSPAVTSSMGAGMTGAVSTTHAFAAAGAHTVTLTITDKDGGSTVKTKSVTIDVADLQPDPTNPAKTALFVGGTSVCDLITVAPPCSGTGLQVTVNNAVVGTFNPTGRVIVFGYAGDDTILLSQNITLPAELYGGDGNDYLQGGAGSNIEVGGAGNDFLSGGNSRDLLIAGAGSDVLDGEGGDDILIAMSTSYDANPAALESIQKEWTRTDATFSQRVSHLTHGGGFNGSNVITVATTFNDGATDILYGDAGSDVFFVDKTDIVADDAHGDQIVTVS